MSTISGSLCLLSNPSVRNVLLSEYGSKHLVHITFLETLSFISFTQPINRYCPRAFLATDPVENIAVVDARIVRKV